ncbi:MAG: aldehyde dehydrogenase family protein [Methylacidiphilales bacterium]|nr:aldehyde dehydrogenase family protein [Candidatus Methylacidiphilales bacterium]
MAEQIAQLKTPVDGSVYATRNYPSDSEVDRVLAQARKAFSVWKTTTIQERQQYCLAFLDAVLKHKMVFAEELSWQMGRPIKFSPGEFRGFEERVRFSITYAPQYLEDVLPPNPIQGVTRYIHREPLGIVFVIAPWNYPYLTAVNTIIPALLAGNVVILKHALQTMLVGERFAQAFQEAKLPEGVFQNILLTHQQTEKIISSGAVDHINFTGSVRGGQAMEHASAGTFASLGLELGGKDPAYVLSDTNLEYAVSNLAEGAFFNSGQCCCGIERIYVEKNIYQKFVESFVEEAKKWNVGNPMDPNTVMGPLVSVHQKKIVQDQIAEAVQKGASTLINQKDNLGGSYLPVEVVVDVNHSMQLMIEENFGPVVGIMSVSSDLEAIQLMNDSPYGLTASLWTTDLARAESVGKQVDTGTFFVNRCDYLDPFLAWTGIKNTGRGATMSRVGYELLTRPKSFYIRDQV